MGTFCCRRLKTNSRNSKENIDKRKDRQKLAGQTFSIPFMNIKDRYVSKKVTFNTQGDLEEKIDRLTSMKSKLTAQDDDSVKQFKPKIYQCKRRRGQTRNIYDRHNYDQRNYQNMYRSKSGDMRITLSGRIQYGQNYRDSPQYNQNYRNDFRRENYRGNL